MRVETQSKFDDNCSQVDDNKFVVKYRHDYYDITKFVHKHPGGVNTLKGLNKDMTKRFMNAPPHSDAAMYLLKEYKIPQMKHKNGKREVIHAVETKSTTKTDVEIIEQDQQEDKNNNRLDESMEHLVDWSKAMLPQIRHITKHYEEWVHKPVDRSLRLFRPWYLEMLTKTPWWVVPAFWLPIILKCVMDEFTSSWQANNMTKVVLLTLYFMSGILLWTLLEYTLHRWVFHMKVGTDSSGWLCTVHFMVHGLHHKVPFDSYRLVFPPIPGAVVASVLYMPFSLFVPWPRVLLGGALFGFLCYDLMHYYLHFGNPRIPHLYKMKRYHYQHHFAHQDLGYGVSSTLWDDIFNTCIHLRRLGFYLRWK